MPPKNGMRPVHPGEILRDELATLNLSANALSKALSVPVNRITTILKGHPRRHCRHGAPAGALLRDDSTGLAELAADLRPALRGDRGGAADRRVRTAETHSRIGPYTYDAPVLERDPRPRG